MATKPWLRKKDTKEITVMGATLTLKRLTFGDSRRAIKKAMNVNMMTQKAEIDATLLGVLRTLAQIESWDLTDENNEVLPITLDTFDNVLDEDFVSALIEAIDKQGETEVTPEEKK